jgi:hypothetical protein
MNGMGTYIWTNGNSYYGFWNSNRKESLGICYYHDMKKIFEEVWNAEQKRLACNHIPHGKISFGCRLIL